MKHHHEHEWRVLRWPKGGRAPAVEATCGSKERALEIALDHVNHEVVESEGANTYTIADEDWWRMFTDPEYAKAHSTSRR